MIFHVHCIQLCEISHPIRCSYRYGCMKDKRERNCFTLLLCHYCDARLLCNYLCMFLYENELSWQDNRCIKYVLSTLRAHFYVISFTKSDLSIISTTFNTVEGSFRDQDYEAYFAYMKLGLKLTWTLWLTFSAVMISTPERLTKVMITCWID